MPMEPPTTAARLAFFYAAFFVVVGIHLPFWPLWLSDQGLTPELIAVVTAVSVGAKVLGNPLIAALADRLGERRRPMRVLAVIATAMFGLFDAVAGFWGILLVSLLFFTAWPPIMALGESLTMLAVRRQGLDYGRIRLWGSIAFIGASLASGYWLAGRSAEVLFWMLLAAVALTAVSTATLPDLRVAAARTTRGSMLFVLRRPGFVPFLAAAAAIQGSHAVYYAFGTLHWRANGLSEPVIGALWAEGVIAEIVLFAFGERLLRPLGPLPLLAVAGLFGGLRWTATALSDALPVVVAAQALHAFSFGAAHLAAVHYIARAVPPEVSATAQSLYAALVMGLALGGILAVSGWLYQSFGGQAYLAMAVLALAGSVPAAIAARRGLPVAVPQR